MLELVEYLQSNLVVIAIPLVALPLENFIADLPGDVRAFLQEADGRIERFRMDRNIPGFVPSDFVGAYRAIHRLAVSDLARGSMFCEWGSGFGVNACLAAMLDFDACGIEIDEELVEESRRLAFDFDISVEFVHGSFIPAGSMDSAEHCGGFSWLATDAATPEPELGPEDFDVIFAYPWPDEEQAIEALFERHARQGAVLVSYHGGEDTRLRRKIVGKRAKRHGDRTR